MSSVGSSDSSGGANRQDEVVRRNREDYRKNESELVKKHQKELRRLNEAHYAEMEGLKKNHASQMEEMQKSSHDALSARDVKFQKDVDEVRNMSRKALEQQAEQNAKADEALRKSVGGEAKQIKAQSEARFKKLSEDYNENLNKRDQFYSENLDKSREQQSDSLKQNRNKLEKVYDGKFEAVKDERNETVARLQNSSRKYRQSAEGRMREQKLHHLAEQQRRSDNLISAVQKERGLRQESEERLREGFDEGLDAIRERFEKSIGKETKALAMSREQLESDVANRTGRQIDRLGRENVNLKEGKTHDLVKMNHQKQREINHIAEAYQKNMDNYKEQRDEAVRQGNERSHKDVADIRKEMEGQMTVNSRYYRDKMDEQNRIQRSAYENLKSDQELRHEQTQMIAENRVKNIYEVTEAEKQRLNELQAEHHTLGQRSHQEEMKNLRATLEDEKQKAISRLQDQMQKQEIHHTDRMSQVVNKYEKQLTALKDQMAHERKLSENNLKRTVEDLQRVHKLGMDQIEAQNRDRVRQLQVQQDQELRSVNKRHEDKLDQVLVEVKKT